MMFWSTLLWWLACRHAGACRAVPLSDAFPTGIEGGVWATISELTGHCNSPTGAPRSEPGCAVQAAVAAGTIESDRFARLEELLAESP